MEKTLGGERLGVGKKIKVDLHNWGRSTHNQSRVWRSSSACGVLVPCFNEIGTNGTTFDIDINAIAHTIPTISPLFGSFKMQIDMFACPFRLYQGILHNNAVNIGLKMSQVLLPKINLGIANQKTNTSSLLNYVGIKGTSSGPEATTFNAIPILAYYDIFKNYYANKQEENAKVIQTSKKFIKINNFEIGYSDLSDNFFSQKTIISILEDEYQGEDLRRKVNAATGGRQKKQEYTPMEKKPIKDWLNSQINKFTYTGNNNYITWEKGKKIAIKSKDLGILNNFEITTTTENVKIILEPDWKTNKNLGLYLHNGQTITNIVGKLILEENQIVFQNFSQSNFDIKSFIIETYEEVFEISDFPLTNIDDARRAILGKTDLNSVITINNDLNFLPYNANIFSQDGKFENLDKQGLMLKTYLNDIYNCWLSTEYVDLINNISSVATDENGKFNIDSLILAKKVYNMLNRIAISGGTYEDWQEAQYGEDAIQRAESPIYIGGASYEIEFEEIVSTAQTEDQPLATLGGKGILTNKKGGTIVYKCNEPCYIMGIMSITPRVDYHQGNKWYTTNLNSMDDLHKPGLDGIGFQNLIANNVHWKASRTQALAKLPAWIEYQTSVNEVFGQFAKDFDEADNLAQMVLKRNYEIDEKTKEITDFTTYIDPSKFNYAFAMQDLKSENFWVQIGFKVKSRRKMATNEIPNL